MSCDDEGELARPLWTTAGEGVGEVSSTATDRRWRPLPANWTVTRDEDAYAFVHECLYIHVQEGRLR